MSFVSKAKKLEEQHTAGKISYDQLAKKGSKLVNKAQKNCAHSHTEKDRNGVKWCANDECGKQL